MHTLYIICCSIFEKTVFCEIHSEERLAEYFEKLFIFYRYNSKNIDSQQRNAKASCFWCKNVSFQNHVPFSLILPLIGFTSLKIDHKKPRTPKRKKSV